MENILMFEILSPQQIKWWVEGDIENLRYDPATQMLNYRITAAPESNISYRVPDNRANRAVKWGDIKDGRSRLFTSAADSSGLRLGQRPTGETLMMSLSHWGMFEVNMPIVPANFKLSEEFFAEMRRPGCFAKLIRDIEIVFD